MASKPWSTLAKIVFKRTYSRKILKDLPGAPNSEVLETYSETVERAIQGNVRGHNVSEHEVERLRYFMLNRKAGPAGRGLWFSGTEAHYKIGGVALNNCWFLTSADWMHFVTAQDLLMLGGGVGMSVEHKYTSKLPKIKKGVSVTCKNTKDADFIVPDSREGWCELTRRVLEAFFVTGKSFNYSTVCVRGYGEPIKGFGGSASGPIPLIAFAEKLSALLTTREGRHLRPIDAADILCAIGEMVVAGNVRRSAIIILGDGHDKEYLKAKRWDLGPIPTQRSKANWSVVCEDIEDLHPLFWKTYEHGEPFGIVNVKNIQKYGRMGEIRKDTAVGVNPCVPAGTQILTRSGYVDIDQALDAEVEVWNGFEWSSVRPKITGYNQPLVRVELSSGQSLVCTTAHKFHIAKDYRGTTSIVDAVELKPGMTLIKASFPVIETGLIPEVPPYSQGFFSGDGITDKKAFFLYGSQKLACASRIVGAVGHYDPKQDRTYISLNFQPLDKSFVPHAWNLAGRTGWLAGLLDSDGTELKEGGAQIGSVNREFLLGVQKMLTTMGVASKVTKMKSAGTAILPDGKGGEAEYPIQDCYRLLIGAVQMQDLLRTGLRCERLKFDKDPQRDASRFIGVVSVTDAGFADVTYCFTESKRHLGCFEGVVTGNCGEATLECHEPCNLQDVDLPNLDSEDEFIEACRLMQRWGKRVTLEKYHIPEVDEVIKRNRRIGTSITGCLQSPLFNPATLDKAYAAIRDEDERYSKELGVPQSIRNTTLKPSGTKSKMDDVDGEGIHCGFSRYMIQRVRFSSNDPLLPLLAEAGHYMEPELKLDGSHDHGTMVVDFYRKTPEDLPVADEGFDTWKQLDALLIAQRHWSDQAVSVTVYYKKDEIPKIKDWLAQNLKDLKTISFLCHNDHGFKQAPKEAISKEQYEKAVPKLKPVDIDGIGEGQELDGTECAGGACPVR